jgi:hypothetical protein
MTDDKLPDGGTPSVHDRAAEALLAETFGIPLLSYLCGVGRDEVQRRLDGEMVLSELAEDMLRRSLVPLAQNVARQISAQPGPPAALSLEILGRVEQGADTSVGNLLRQEAGAELPEPVVGTVGDSDRVKIALFLMARDCYPVLLAPTGSWPSRISLLSHPASDALQEALLGDEHLGKLYPDEDPGLGRRGMHYNSIGRGGGGQSVSFGGVVIAAAWDFVVMTESEPSLGDLLRVIDRNIDTIRAAAGGGTPEVDALLVFTGFSLPEGTVVETVWGTLRPLNALEARATPEMLAGSVSGVGPDGASVTVAYGGECALETKLPYALVVLC